MKLLLLTLLAISTLSQEDPITCKDGVVSGSFSTDKSQGDCTCSCASSSEASTCNKFDDVKAAFACIEVSKCTPEQNDIRTELRRAAGRTNPLVAPNECETAQLTFDSTASECSADIIKCDQTPTCTSFNAAEPKYACNMDDYTCRQKLCNAVTDQYGNTVATMSLDTSKEQVNDATICQEECKEPPTQSPASRDECISGILSSDDLCYYKCILGDDGVRRLSDTATDIATVFGDFDALEKLRSVCKNRNDQLLDCKPEFIEPNVVGDEYLKSRTNCGCGKCVEKCEYEKRYVHYKGDDGNAKCKLITCTTREETRTAATSLATTNTKETYYNIRRDISEQEVELIKCTEDDDDTPAPVTCANPCADGEKPFCVYDADAQVEKTFKCEREFACALEEANDATKFRIRKYTPCRDTTEDECSLDDPMRVKDEYVQSSKCRRLCKCVPNKDPTKGNIEICDTIERNIENIKKECATKLATDCKFENFYFNECPLASNDICEKLYCDTENDPNDPSTGGVCRRSAEKFESTIITKRDESVGCKFQECDDDENSETYGQLIAKRYDLTTTDSKGIIRACPRLATCKALAYNTNGVCNVCPVCDEDSDDDTCDTNALNKGDNACKEEPDDDDTRDKPDGTRDEFKGKVRIKLAARFCADDFFGYTRDEIYRFIKEGVYGFSGECGIAADDLMALRAYISSFDYDITDKLSTDTCDTMLKVEFRVDLCDVELERLKKLLNCFQELKENDTVDIRARIATGIKDATSTTRFSKEASTEDPTKTDDSADISAASAESVAELSLTDMDGNPIEYDVATTETPCDNKKDCEGGNGANGYSVVMGVMVSFIVYFVY